MITVGSFFNTNKRACSVNSLSLTRVKISLGVCDNILQIFICGITLCSTNICGNDTRHPRDEAILWACTVNLIGTKDRGAGGEDEAEPWRDGSERIQGHVPHWEPKAHSTRPCDFVEYGFGQCCVQTFSLSGLSWASYFTTLSLHVLDQKQMILTIDYGDI